MLEFNQALSTLRNIPESNAIRLLEELAEDANAECRARSIGALAKLFPRSSQALAIKLLNDPEWFVRVASIDALSQLKSKSAIPTILFLLNSDEDECVRSWAAFFLGVVGDDSVIPSLVKCIDEDKGTDHEGTPIAETASKAIHKIRSRH